MRRLAAAACVTLTLAVVPMGVSAEPPEQNRGAAKLSSSSTDLLPGQGSARVAVTANGKFAVVHQGDSYHPKVLLKVNLRATPARVVGQMDLPANTNSELALVKNKFALTTHGDELWVSDIRKATPKRVGRFSFKVKGSKATLFDVAVTPDGKFAYLAARDWIHDPGTHLLVVKVRNNGKPKLVRRIKVESTELAVSRNGKRLIAATGKKAHVFNIGKPAKPKKMGKPIKVKGGDIRGVVFGKSAKVAYALSSHRKRSFVTRLQTKKRKVTHRRVLTTGSFLGAGGGLAVSANGKRVLATNVERWEHEPSAWLLNAKLKPVKSLTGACLPGSAAASLAGPTKGRLFMTDSGICGQARLWRVR